MMKKSDMRNLTLKNVRNFKKFTIIIITLITLLDFCDICGNKTLLKTNLKAHMKTHLISNHNNFKNQKSTGKSQNFSCPCGKVFKNRSQLVDHTRRIHENIRDHKCQYCGMYYAMRELKVHLKRVHMKGEKFIEKDQEIYLNLYF